MASRPPAPTGKPKSVPIREVVRYLLQHWTTYAPMFIGVASSTVLAFGGQAWHAAFFARTYGWSAPQFATIFGIAIVVLGPFSLIGGQPRSRSALPGRASSMPICA